MNERINWIDIAKGIGIFLVVYTHFTQHIYSNNIINILVTSFHMPLFFVIAGILAKPKDNPILYIYKKSYDYLLPYYFTSLIFVILNYNKPVLEIIKQISFYNGSVCYLGQIWFLSTLFEVILIYYLFRIYKLNNIFKILLMLIFYFILLILKYYNIKLPFDLNTALMGFIFFILGNVIFSEQKIVNIIFKKNSIIIFFIIWTLSLIPVSNIYAMGGMGIDNYFLFIISGLFGSLIIFFISKYLGNCIYFLKCGKYTLFILYTHCIITNMIFPKIYNKYCLNYHWSIYLILLIITYFLLYIYILICPIIEKYCPIILCKRKNN